MKRAALVGFLVACSGCGRWTSVNFDPVYRVTADGEITVYLGSKCPKLWECHTISRVRVIDQDGVTLADIQEH